MFKLFLDETLKITTNPVKVDLAVMAKKRYSTLPKDPKQEPHYQIQISVISETLVRGGALPPPAEKQSVYSPASADWDIKMR